MQGYTWTSNQRPSQRYQDRPPPQYQERPPQYHERSPPPHQGQFPPNYHAARNDQPGAFQGQLNPQQQTTLQARYPNGQQEARNQWNACPGNADSSTSHQYSNGYNWLIRTNQIHPQNQYAASQTQQHYSSDNSNGYRGHAQLNYRNTGYDQMHASPMHWSQQPDHGSSGGNNRGRGSHISNNGNSCSINNQQQQFQAPRMAGYHHQQQQQRHQQQHNRHQKQHHQQQQNNHQQQEFYRQYSGQKRRLLAHLSRAYQKNPYNQAQSRPKASLVSCKSTTPPSGAQSNVTFPSTNLNPSPVDQNGPVLGSNECPNASLTQPQNNQNTGHQSQGTNNGTCNVNLTSQITQNSSEAKLQTHTTTNFKSSSYVDSVIHRLLCSPVDQNVPVLGSNECPNASLTQPQNNQNTGHQLPSYADSIIYRLLFTDNNGHSCAPQNTRPEQSAVCATKSTDNHSKQPFSEPRAQCTVEPPSKRMKFAVIQTDCWNKVAIVSTDKSHFGVQSGTHKTSSDENRHSQHNIQYSTDPADCLEAVFALQKAALQSYKAIAIVPPISQQISNASPAGDTSPKKPESPPLKIDCVWSLADECFEQKTLNDKLSEFSQVAQQDDKSMENTTECNIAEPDACSVNQAECQNDVQQSDCVSSDPLFHLSTVPVIEHTLENLMDLAKSLEKTEFSSKKIEYSENVFERILKLYWNGNSSNVLEHLKSFGEIEQSTLQYAKDYGSVVFKSIESENLKKLANCEILKDEMYLSSEEFRFSWLNVDGQPADIEKELSDPPLDDADVFKATSQTFSDSTIVASASLGVNSPTDVPEVSPEEKSVNPHTSSLDLFKQKAGNDREEVTAENNGHSYVELRKESEKETLQLQEDIDQNQSFNTEASDVSPLVERPTENLPDLGNAKEVFRQDLEQTHDTVSDSQALSPGDSVSEGVKNIEASFSTSIDTWQVEDISDDENPGNKEALDSSSDTRLVEDISNDENPVSKEVLNSSSETCQEEDISDDENQGNKEPLNSSSDTWLLEDISNDEYPVSKEDLNNFSGTCQVENISNDEYPVSKEDLNNSSETCQVEDISNDENQANKVALNSSSDTWLLEDISNDENQANKEPLNKTSDTCLVEDISDKENSGNKEVHLNSLSIWPVEDISDRENQGNMDTPINTSDICVMEDVSTDENSSNDSLFMGITVLSKEDAQTLFQLFEKEPECSIKTKSQSNLEHPDLVACLDVHSQPNHKYNKANTCSRCGTEIVKSGSTNVTKIDSEADLLCPECWEQAPLLELEEEPNESSLLGSAAKPQNYNLPCLKLEVNELNLASTEECIAYEGQNSGCLVKSKFEEICSAPSLEIVVKESIFASVNECTEYEGLAGQKSEQAHDCSPPSVEMKDSVALSESRIAEEGLTGQKKDCMTKSELVKNCSQPSLKLESTVASTKECSAGQAQKTETMLQSEQLQQSEVEMPKVSTPVKCIADEGMQSPKRNSESEMGHNCRAQSIEMKVKESNFVLEKTCIADEGQTGQKSDCMEESELGQNCSTQCLKLDVKEPTVALADKRLTRPKSDSRVKLVTKTVSEIQGSAGKELTKIRRCKQKTEKTNVAKPESLTQCRKQCPKKAAFSKNKLNSGSTSTAADDSVLFAPDIVVKSNCPQKRKLPANKRRIGEGQNRSKVKKLKKQDNPDETLTSYSENVQKVTEKVSSQLNDKPSQESENKLELHGILLVNKIKSKDSKKVRFDLYGSKKEKQYYAKERRFSAPASLTVSDCTDYNDVLSAKQKVLNQWSSTFIAPKTKKTSAQRSLQERSSQEASPQKGSPQKDSSQKDSSQKGSPKKNKPQKPQDLLKSNMSALKRHLTHRAKLLSSSDRESQFRKPFHPKLRKTLSS